MPIHLDEQTDGRLLFVHVSGKLDKTDYQQFVPEVERLIHENGKLRILFDMTNFHGWDASGMWEDFKFGVKHFSDVERIAMVGETKWQEGMAKFCKPFTSAAIRYFDHADADAAHAWLESGMKETQPVASTVGSKYGSS